MKLKYNPFPTRVRISWWSNRLLIIARYAFPVELLVLAGAATDSSVRPRYPQDDMGKDSLPSRQKAQIEAATPWFPFRPGRLEATTV